MRRPAVKKYMVRYLNPILSITIMLLMAIALVAGQATPLGAGVKDGTDRVAYQAIRAAGDE
jgi:hypothetical protein